MFTHIFLISTGLLTIFIIISLAYSFSQEFRKDRVPALCYHRLLSRDDLAKGVPNNERIYVSYADRFEEQMKYLMDNGYNAISMDDFVACVEGRKNLPEKPIMITFDDGFESVYKYAYPVLKKYNLTATIFATPDPESENFKVLKGIDCRLTDEQMKEMSHNGVCIESHGMTHRFLTNLPEGKLEWELKESKSTLERITGKSVNFLAIPGGAYNRRVRKIAKEIGYKAIFGQQKGSNNPKSDLFSLRRIVVERDFTLDHFAKAITPLGAFQMRIIGWLKRVPQKFLGYRRGDIFRNWLYQSKMGPIFIFRNFRFILLTAIIFTFVLAFIGFYWSTH